jgi:hypothetical protein
MEMAANRGISGTILIDDSFMQSALIAGQRVGNEKGGKNSEGLARGQVNQTGRTYMLGSLMHEIGAMFVVI